MRTTLSLLGLSTALFCTAVAVPGQGQTEPTAEQQFKNIKSFKGEKASAIIPAMEFMSASLKVGCDFCHTDDRASDQKEEKNTAREMVAMQRDINQKHFGGRNVITCATCHAGHPHPVPVPPVTGVEIRPRRSADVVPDTVFATFAKSVGWDSAHPLTGLRLQGDLEEHGEKSKVEAIYSGQNYTMISKRKKGDQRQGFSTPNAWFAMPQGIQVVPLQFAEQYVRMNLLFLTPDSLPKLTNPSGGTAKVNDADTLVVSGTLPNSTTRAAFYFDKKTGLISRSAYTYPSVLGSIIQINDYSNYKKVNGVQVPMTVAIHNAEGDSVRRFKSAKVDPSIDASTFAPPKK